ncbi:aryl hydrocarbon receptor nuclear translocator-like protein [Lasius niger]|uniref:Aryl hydrocarbon receptor nuclear translocator-like protein n=1 Tax=Lasius niger TaxID=67767 RepID=A0A0J7N8Q8_LASNI|nr:aryl hydrocarbon receptor nuclear translocator-like protein [Lasius niger]
MYGGGSAGSAGYGVGLGPGPGPSHYAAPSATVGYQLGPPPPPPPPPSACPTAGSQLLSYGSDLSPHHIQQAHTETQQSKRRR